jgi:ABC-2 type transport system permease protein
MITIYCEDLKQSFISIRSFIVIALVALLAFLYGKYAGQFVGVEKTTPSSALFSIISGLSLFLAALIFSGTMSKTIDNKSIRYILLCQSKEKVILSKFMAIFSYFIILVFGTWIVVSIISLNFSLNGLDLINTISMSFYSASFIMLLSTIIKKESLVFFVGILSGICLPILGLIGLGVKNIFFVSLSWILPFRYVDIDYGFLVVFVMGIILLGITLVLFRNMEL